MDPFESFKAAQKQGWVHFAPFEAHHNSLRGAAGKASGRPLGTTRARRSLRDGRRFSHGGAPRRSRHRARSHARVVGAGAGECAHCGESKLIGTKETSRSCPLSDAAFDVVLSEFGHIFAPRPEVAIGEMLRVLKPGGTIAFSTWPPELFVGRMFALTASYLPPPPPGVAPPPLWGDPNIVRQRLGSAVKDILFDRATMLVPALSPSHQRTAAEKSAGAMVRLVASLQGSDPAKLEQIPPGIRCARRRIFRGQSACGRIISSREPRRFERAEGSRDSTR